jgi:hypothetical protein
MKTSLLIRCRVVLGLALAVAFLTACQTLNYRKIQDDFNKSLQTGDTGSPRQHARVLERLTPEYIGTLDPTVRPNAWMLRSISAWQLESNDVALAASRRGLGEPTLVAGSRDHVILEMIPALVIDSDLYRRWINAGKTLTASEYTSTYETTGFVQAWRQLSGPARNAISAATPDEVIFYFHFQRWRLIMNWAAVITSITPADEFVAAQARACAVLGVDRDPMFAAQKEVDQIPDTSPLSKFITAQGWVPPVP